MLQLGSYNKSQKMTPFRLYMIGKSFWNHIFCRKCRLASGGLAVIMADPPKWTFASVWYKNPCWSNYYQQSSDYNIKGKTFKTLQKGTFQTHCFTLFLILFETTCFFTITISTFELCSISSITEKRNGIIFPFTHVLAPNPDQSIWR